MHGKLVSIPILSQLDAFLMYLYPHSHYAGRDSECNGLNKVYNLLFKVWHQQLEADRGSKKFNNNKFLQKALPAEWI